jgi:hypothetical protein
MNMFRAFMELDEACSNRQTWIDDLKRAGKNYNFNKYTDAQIYCMWQKIQKPIKKLIEPKHELDLDFDSVDLDYCECGTRLSDAGFCPICDDGEEHFNEGIFDGAPVTRRNWVTASGKSVTVPSANTQTTQVNQTPIQQVSSTLGKYVVRIVSDHGRLRALATDGVHPAGWVAFPNSLRQFEGQTYEVDQLIWNGKNYRVAGNIVEI